MEQDGDELVGALGKIVIPLADVASFAPARHLLGRRHDKLAWRALELELGLSHANNGSCQTALGSP